MAEIFLVRHGQTEWSRDGRHTSTTDIDLTELGVQQAERLRPLLDGREYRAVLSSPRTRALKTAKLAGLPDATVDADLAEWDYGDYEGLTTPEIRAERPGWSVWRDGAPNGESPGEIGTRMNRVLERADDLLTGGDVVLVGHAHALRVAAAHWIGLGTRGGGLLWLDTATVSALGYEREQRVIRRWNIAP
ncbi:phosphoglycerate mutase [Actinorhabdospora filicis]|uniref:Phosphoglycerate mutase n=1 Tax=Actinorhabdospora filicis TaxID=1785913 RepID=A0A9W6W826_9ACTN|nr:histidine phosphatase family protein [Actinorhabdospora filicis]GLZ76538.1 phosphoglycerate mutase [Actinorhabdospora filicis]